MIELKQMMKSMSLNLQSVSVSVNTLGENLNKKIDELKITNTMLAERVETVNTAIREDLQKLETKINLDLEKIGRESASLRESIVKNKDEVDTEVNALKRELEEAHVQIDLQKNRFFTLEKSTQRGLQHARGWNVEIDGLPTAVGDDPDDLQVAVMKLCDGLGVEIDECEIDTVHRLPSKNAPKPVIVRFVTRKTVRALHDKKHKLKYLKDLELDIDGLKEDSHIYIRANLSPYFNNLAYNCRSLKRKHLIRMIKIGKDGKLSVQKIDGSFVQVSHESDLTKNFPLFENFNFEYDRSFLRGENN